MLYFGLRLGKAAKPFKELLMKVLYLLYSLGTLNQIKNSQGNNSTSRHYTNIDSFILNVFKCNSPNTYWKGLFPTRFPWLYTFQSLLNSSSICWNEMGSYFMTSTHEPDALFGEGHGSIALMYSVPSWVCLSCIWGAYYHYFQNLRMHSNCIFLIT